MPENGSATLKVETLRRKRRQLCPDLADRASGGRRANSGGPLANSGGLRANSGECRNVAGLRQSKTTKDSQDLDDMKKFQGNVDQRADLRV